MFLQPGAKEINPNNLVAPTGFEPVFQSRIVSCSDKVPHHPQLGERGRVPDGPGLAGGQEPATVVERDGRSVGGGDPERQASGSTRPGPGGHRLHERDADTMSTLRRIDEHPDEDGS